MVVVSVRVVADWVQLDVVKVTGGHVAEDYGAYQMLLVLHVIVQMLLVLQVIVQMLMVLQVMVLMDFH